MRPASVVQHPKPDDNMVQHLQRCDEIAVCLPLCPLLQTFTSFNNDAWRKAVAVACLHNSVSFCCPGVALNLSHYVFIVICSLSSIQEPEPCNDQQVHPGFIHIQSSQ